MRFDVKKYLFIGYRQALESFFSKAQEAGLVHFIDTRQIKAKEVPQEIQTITSAIKVLRELPTLDQEEPESYAESDRIAGEVLHLRHAIEKLEEEQRIGRLDIERIDVFGDFSLEDLRYLEETGGRIVQFFFSKKGGFDGQKLPPELIFIASKHGLDYFVSISKEKKAFENMVEMKIDHELGQLKRRMEAVKVQIRQHETKLKALAKYVQFLHRALLLKSNNFNLDKAKSYASDRMDGSLFAVEGWVPQHKSQKLQALIDDLDVYMVEVSIAPDEVIPTYLENQGTARIGEDLVHIYDTPSNTDKDPSLWVLFSFALFFAMIIGDGGYGLLFLAAALYFRYKNRNLQKAGLRVWKLAVLLCCSCIAWGLLTNSFFAISFSPESPVRKVSVINWLVHEKAAYHFEKKDDVYQDWVAKYPALTEAETPRAFLMGAVKGTEEKPSYPMMDKFSDGILMELALLVGIIHVSLSFLRYLDRNWSGIGWIIAIFGCYFYFPLFLKATSIQHFLFGLDRESMAQQGLYLIYGGLGLAVGLGVLKNKLYGLLEIPNVIQVFADILSYLRLYALALAGSIISQTVNDIAGSLLFVGGGILLLIGHGLNIVLAVMGGVIHGLRLNFIEWYHYSFEGGGKLFTPLRKVEIEEL